MSEGSGPTKHAEQPTAAQVSLDQRRFEQVFNDHFPAVFRYIARRVGGDVADDLAAETFVIGYQRRESYDPRRATMLAWLYGIAHNLVRNERRAEQRQLQLLARLPVDLGQPEPTDAPIAAHSIGARLIAALSRLNDDQRDALLFKAFTTLSEADIAVVLELPAGTVRSRLSRARAALRDEFGSFDFDNWTFGRDASVQPEESQCHE